MLSFDPAQISRQEISSTASRKNDRTLSNGWSDSLTTEPNHGLTSSTMHGKEASFIGNGAKGLVPKGQMLSPPSNEEEEGSNIMGNGCGEALSPTSTSSFLHAAAYNSQNPPAELTVLVPGEMRTRPTSAVVEATQRTRSSDTASLPQLPSHFSFEGFAPFFEVAICELLAECDRRILRAPASPPIPSEISSRSFDSPVTLGPQYPATQETAAQLMTILGKLLDGRGAAAPMILIAALSYLSKIAHRCASKERSITPSNWYRMTLSAVLCASKMYNEFTTRRLNKLFSIASGIPLGEINQLEIHFLYLLDFSLLLDEGDVVGWIQWMDNVAKEHHLPPPFGDLSISEIDQFSVRGLGPRQASQSELTTVSLRSYPDSSAIDVPPSYCNSFLLSQDTEEEEGGRLFSVVHGGGELDTPPHTGRGRPLEDGTPLPPEPPVNDSPVSFFKTKKNFRPSARPAVVPTSSPRPTFSAPVDVKTSEEDSSRTTTRSSSRWRVLQSVKEVLTVSASLFSGNLQVLSPHHGKDPSNPSEEEYVYDIRQTHYSGSGLPLGGNRRPFAATAIDPTATLPIVADENHNTSSFYPPEEETNDPYCPEDDEEGYYDEEGNYYYYDEEDYGYYDPEGVFHYYEEEEEYEEEESDDDDGMAQDSPEPQRAPPRTHSPPAL